MPDAIETHQTELRHFAPSSEFVARANVSDSSLHDAGDADSETYWAGQARELLHWDTEWSKVLDWDPPNAKWFVDGTLNVTYNCLDRHIESGHGSQVAFFWEGEPGDERAITYSQLLEDVSRCANALKELGVQRGDRVAIYMGMVPELTVAMLACARIGAAHSVVFGGFSSDSLRGRINDAEAKIVITCDGAWRRGGVVALKDIVDEALLDTPTIEKCIVLRRTDHGNEMTDGRDIWWHDLVDRQSPECVPEPMDAEQLLFILYTSGTTAKPKGIMHTTGGYLTGVTSTFRSIFDIHPDEDIYWCTADCGWVTGHSYIVYGPLANRATSVLYEGTPDYPDKDRFWAIVEKYAVTILYTAPTAIRTFMKWGVEYPGAHDLTSLRLLGSVGEPINPEAWIWYHDVIGGSKTPIVDTWWQTETGAVMISPLPGVTTLKPGSATFAMPGIGVDVVGDDGRHVGIPGGGYLVLTKPWPSMLRGVWGDPERFQETYWSRFPGLYFAGDGARYDDEGYMWLLGRVDDVMLVSGHNISTAEVESALVDHHAVAEAAVVGVHDPTTGQAISAFVVLKNDHEPSKALEKELRIHVGNLIGAIARPKSILFTDDLPKTRSGKIMRRLLRNVADDETLGDTTTLADPGVVARIKDRYLSVDAEDDEVDDLEENQK